MIAEISPSAFMHYGKTKTSIPSAFMHYGKTK
jgi:hypothetical protein